MHARVLAMVRKLVMLFRFAQEEISSKKLIASILGTSGILKTGDTLSLRSRRNILERETNSLAERAKLTMVRG